MRDDCNGHDMTEHAWIVMKSADGCVKAVPLKHAKWYHCPLCEERWIKALYAKFYARYERSGVDLSHVMMWTLGTNLRDSPKNRQLLSRWWSNFRRWMNKRQVWQPVFRVVEVGSKGRRLHIHVMLVSPVKHAIILQQWRRITGMKANVNYTRPEYGEPKDLLRYLLKYLLKDKSTYYWMGRFYGIQFPRYENVCEHGFVYSGIAKVNVEYDSPETEQSDM